MFIDCWGKNATFVKILSNATVINIMQQLKMLRLEEM